MEKLLITYSDGKILAVNNAPQGGIIVSGVQVLIATIEEALTMLSSIGVDTTLINEFIIQRLNK